jgi:hypothetical protein
MTMQFADIARQAAQDGAVSAEEILALRRAGWSDGAMKPDEAEAVMALNDALAERTAEWCDFFVEAIGEYVVNGTEPKGYVSDDNAAWLISRLDRDGKIDSMAELELLVRVLERAQNVPQSLKAYALEQIEQAVLTGSGPTRRGGELAPNSVNDAEAQLLRRVLFAAAGDAPAAVSRAEAELLFRLKDAARGSDNGAEWKRLFAQGVGNYLMGFASPNAQIARERAADLEAFMDRAGFGAGGFARRVLTSKPDFQGAFDVIFDRTKGRDRFGELAEGERVTGEERAWLETHTHADGEVDEYEQAVLDFLAEE